MRFAAREDDDIHFAIGRPDEGRLKIPESVWAETASRAINLIARLAEGMEMKLTSGF